ncbi:hypothetical protein L227DRAFT_25649 [Lentinus tigrinus ALCF2SS1-6]|uniref:Uncharacterized protein n=1 Tax=Lentinus tigrinus ALCF2SS1-6 TaxID=1328759 RepID=A0A5C2T753_9APHY|nr:hypothetical protein L227DRAFT_25649 [Lentinus tigrinus ALCF2SS1-6]
MLAALRASACLPSAPKFPKHKGVAFFFVSTILTGMHPAPDQVPWLTFGFVAGHELRYSRSYAELIRCCTFEEPREAYEASSIPALFARHGIVSVARDRLFLDVMSGSPIVFKSVWSLKQYVDQVASASPDQPPLPEPAVMCDYGFGNCKNAEEWKLLDELYKKLFAKGEYGEMDPLALHAACIKGELLEFVKGFVKLSPWTAKYTRLLKNPYPLAMPVT